MPLGTVRFYNKERGFGFVVSDDGESVFLPAKALPDGVSDLSPGTRVDYGAALGKKGSQVLSLRVLRKPSRRGVRSTDDMAVIIEDLMKILDEAGESFKRGRYPKAERAKVLAAMLRQVADGLDAN